MSNAWITIFTVSVSAELNYQQVHKILVITIYQRPEKGSVVNLLFIAASIICWGFVFWSLFCNAVLSVLSRFAIFSQRKRELVLFLLSCGC